MKNLFLTTRFFIAFGVVLFTFLLSFPIRDLFPVAQTLLVATIAITIADALLLFAKNTRVVARRIVPKILSLGDNQTIHLEVENHSNLALTTTLIDELPMQFQKRDFELSMKLQAGEARKTDYALRPTERGEYHFGDINIFIASLIGLIQRRIIQPATTTVPVYPSVIQMKKYEFKGLHQIAHGFGLKKIRRIGHSYEFEQIKNYVAGDDFRSVNWKASGRRGAIMVNQYEDERAQQIYCIIDKSRVMRMPFAGLSLMDHAINTSLVIANIILHKKDKVGLLSFSDKIGSVLQAETGPNQLNRILHELYKEKEGKGEASYELLYYAVRRLIRGRSLLMLFTNFETMFALERVLPTMRLMNNLHLLVVVFFINTEIEDFAKQTATSTEDIYHQAIAQKYLDEQSQIALRLRQYGIQTILTRPEDLSMNTINKYLELKSRGLI